MAELDMSHESLQPVKYGGKAFIGKAAMTPVSDWVSLSPKGERDQRVRVI